MQYCTRYLLGEEQYKFLKSLRQCPSIRQLGVNHASVKGLMQHFFSRMLQASVSSVKLVTYVMS